MQFIPKRDAQSGDRVREVGHYAQIDDMPRVTRLDAASGLFVIDGTGERLVPFDRVDAVVRVIVVPR
ncbi:hypothetical protein [uncultured Alsobacter sp.]|uniref:hypothetical protein n=1 Tax=uncultured Alsobacter sp. TaxID=1748258 RepID=UPI0025D47A9E|nr:hypothetical protein [uncultured Alsobacter sp.]